MYTHAEQENGEGRVVPLSVVPCGSRISLQELSGDEAYATLITYGIDKPSALEEIGEDVIFLTPQKHESYLSRRK